MKRDKTDYRFNPPLETLSALQAKVEALLATANPAARVRVETTLRGKVICITVLPPEGE